MPWCPKCDKRYSEAFTVCEKCNELLLYDLPKNCTPSKEENSSVLLMNVNDEKEAENIEEILNANDIRVSRKYNEAEDYLKVYMEMALNGVALYVNKKDFKKAKNIVDRIKNYSTKDDDTVIFQNPITIKFKEKIHIVIMFFVPVLLIVLFKILYY